MLYGCSLAVVNSAVRNPFVSFDIILPCFCRGRLKTMMVTGDHSMTGIAVSQQIGMLTKTQPIVVFDKEAPKKGLTAISRPNSTDLPNSPYLAPGGPNSPHVALKAAALATPVKPEQKSAALRRSLGQGRTAGSVLGSSRLSSSVTALEATDAAAFRASLRKSTLADVNSDAVLACSPLGFDPGSSAVSVPGAAAASALLPPDDSPAAVPASAAASVLPPADDPPAAGLASLASQAYPLHAPSLSCRPIMQGSTASSTSTPEAVALAASSQLFKSSLLAPVSKAPASASSSSASSGTSKAPSPLLASYLKSMGGARQSSNPPGSVQFQQASVAQRSHAHFPDELPTHAQPESAKLTRLGKSTDDSRAFGQDANQLSSAGCTEVEDARLSMDSVQAESRSDSQTQLLPQSSATQLPHPKPHSRFQLHTQTQKPQTQAHMSASDKDQLLRSCLKASSQQPQPMSHEVTHAESPHAESEFSQQRRKTSFDLRQWAVEQSRKQQSLSPQSLGLALSGLRRSLEMQSGHRNRSLDLVRADVQNMRLSFDSANLPSDEKLRWVRSIN